MSLNNQPPPSFSLARRWSISLNVLLSVLAVLALVAMVNYLAARHFQRIPVSTLARAELGPQTRRILQSVTNNVRVTIYYDRDGSETLYKLVNDLLKEYKFANPRIGVETIDYRREPPAAQLLKAKYKLTAPEDKNLVIFDCNNNVKIIYERDLTDFDLEPLISGRSREARRSTFKGELLFTSAIYTVTSARALKAYFLTGHGEHLPDSTSSGFSKFAGVLKENNIDWAIATNDIPRDCSLLIIAGPRSAMLPDELAKIEEYLSNGGRALVLFNYIGVLRKTGLEKTLSDWGVDVGQNVVFDGNAGTRGGLLISTFSRHAIAVPLAQSGLGLYMAYPRTVRRTGRGAHKTDTPNVTELIYTGPDGQVVDDFRNGVPQPSVSDTRTNVPLAVAIEKGKLEGLRTQRGTTRMVVMGDSTCWANNMLDERANRDFASLAINWLLDRSELLESLAARPIPERRLVMTKSQMLAVQWILFLVMPGSVLLVGTAVWVQRRH